MLIGLDLPTFTFRRTLELPPCTAAAAAVADPGRDDTPTVTSDGDATEVVTPDTTDVSAADTDDDAVADVTVMLMCESTDAAEPVVIVAVVAVVVLVELNDASS